jgi:hypothetical protein
MLQGFQGSRAVLSGPLIPRSDEIPILTTCDYGTSVLHKHPERAIMRAL